MDDLLSKWVPTSWVRLSSQANRRREKQVEMLLTTGAMPEEGWQEAEISSLLDKLSAMDSNNYLGNVGAGEREGRVFSNLVRTRHFGLAHGIGRSGDVSATQPKAPGSSVVAKLTQSMVLDLMRKVLNLMSIRACLVLPCATGMSLTLVLLALKSKLPDHMKYVIWTRIDQKTCLKAIVSAGFIPLVVENQIVGDRVVADMEAVAQLLKTRAGIDVAAVVTTTSCFAPRVPDDVETVAKLCNQYGTAHVINNAYGLQCTKCCHYVEQACRLGRVDAVVQSTDKNFMVPVGGAIVSSPNTEFMDLVSKTYPGRASIDPVLDLFITLLQMGKRGYDELRKQRITLATSTFVEMLQRVALRNGLRLLDSSQRNTISFALALRKEEDDDQHDKTKSHTEFGSMLFLRGVSGARVVTPQAGKETVAGLEFIGYGSSHSSYPVAYVTVACAMGFECDDVVILEKKLNDACADFYKS